MRIFQTKVLEYAPTGGANYQEYADFTALPAPGDPAVVYVTAADDKQFRWTGTQYVEVLTAAVTDIATAVSNRLLPAILGANGQIPKIVGGSVVYVNESSGGTGDSNAPAPDVVITENFTQTDGVYAGLLTPITFPNFAAVAGNISNNQLVMTGGNAAKGYRFAGTRQDAAAEVKLISGNGDSGLGIVGRLQPDGSCYSAYAAKTPGFTRIYYSGADGSSTALTNTSSYVVEDGDTLKFSCVGRVLIFSYLRGGVETIIHRIANDLIAAGGSFGLQSDLTVGTFDDAKLVEYVAGISIRARAR